MLIQSWYYQLLGTIPEAIATVALGVAIIKERYTARQISLAGLIIGLISFFLQQIPIKYGVHIPLGVVAYILTLNLLYKLHIVKSAAAAISSFIVLVCIESLAFFVQVNVFGFDEQMLTEGSEASRFLLSMPPLGLLFIAAIAAQMWLRLRPKGGNVK
ncbi:MAG: hypothetical protein ACOX30_01515 [Dethiobacteria bacterium]